MTDNTTKPTPGPWTLERDSSMSYWDVYGVLLPDNKNEYLVARVIDSNDSAQNDANARLIAASPTLYAYVAAKATEGDADAARIIANI